MVSTLHKIAFQIAAGLTFQVGAAMAATQPQKDVARQMGCAVHLTGLDLIERRIEAGSVPGLYERSTRFDEARRYFNIQAVKHEKPEALVAKAAGYADGLRHKYAGQADWVEAALDEATDNANKCYIYHDEKVVLPRSRIQP